MIDQYMQKLWANVEARIDLKRKRIEAYKEYAWENRRVCGGLEYDYYRESIGRVGRCRLRRRHWKTYPIVELCELAVAPTKMDDVKIKVNDLVHKVELGGKNISSSTYISAKLSSNQQKRLIDTLKKFWYCFSWDHKEISKLNWWIVEHNIPLKPGYLSHKQLPRRFSEEVVAKFKWLKGYYPSISQKLCYTPNGYQIWFLSLKRRRKLESAQTSGTWT